MNIPNKRILIIEDHPIASHVIATSLLEVDDSLELTIKADKATALAALRDCAKEEPWFRIFLDLDISASQGLSLLKHCAALNLSERCIAIVNRYQPQRIAEVKEIGVLGFIEKSLLLQDFKNGLVSTLKGQSAYHENSSLLIASALLSPKQRKTLCLLQRGFSAPKIAAQLGLDLETIDSHVTTLMRTFPTSGKMHAVAMAIELGHLESTGNPC
jgi:DNA-binding NarL/FixJ family response regulator